MPPVSSAWPIILGCTITCLLAVAVAYLRSTSESMKEVRKELRDFAKDVSDRLADHGERISRVEARIDSLHGSGKGKP